MTNMKAKTALYAAVGAPVVAARKVGDRVTEIRATLSKEADSLGKSANKRVNVWATEGEKVVSRLSDGKMVDELAAKVDFEQVSEQVSRLRDQLEDMLATWRASFRPEKAATPRKASVTTTIKTEAAPTTAPKKAAAPKAAAKKASATKATAKKSTTTKKVAAPKAASKKAS
jgi:histone H1/5